jgi:hypothetical protein
MVRFVFLCTFFSGHRSSVGSHCSEDKVGNKRLPFGEFECGFRGGYCCGARINLQNDEIGGATFIIYWVHSIWMILQPFVCR